MSIPASISISKLRVPEFDEPLMRGRVIIDRGEDPKDAPVDALPMVPSSVSSSPARFSAMCSLSCPSPASSILEQNPDSTEARRVLNETFTFPRKDAAYWALNSTVPWRHPRWDVLNGKRLSAATLASLRCSVHGSLNYFSGPSRSLPLPPFRSSTTVLGFE
ncbi:hypothetical protein EDB85DRAFT_1899102 [Lactarius pseudohatsudake]|nr:hypothetical protein EDB85DRAFT_1899102 [Lactarius pseudohatsudake]